MPQIYQDSFQWEALVTHLCREGKQEPMATATAKKGDNKLAKKPKIGTKHICRTCLQPRESHVCTGAPVIPVETKKCEMQTEEHWKTNDMSDSFEVSNVEEAEKEEIIEPECNEAEVEDLYQGKCGQGG
jgi:hypothetical protein